MRGRFQDDSTAAAVPALFWTTDTDLRVTSVHGSGIERLGFAREQLAGRLLVDLPGVAGEAIDAHRRALAGETVDAPLELFGRSWSVEAQPLRNGSDEILGVIGLAVDVTDITRAHQRVIRREQYLDVQRALSAILAEGKPLEQTWPKLLSALCRIMGWCFGAVWTADDGEDAIRCVETWSDDRLDGAEFEKVTRSLVFAPGVGLPGRVWESGRPAIIADVTHDSNFPRASHAEQANLHAAIGVPILSGGRGLGVVEFFTTEIGTPDEELGELLGLIAGQLGEFVERKRAEEALREAELRYRRLVEHLPLVTYVNALRDDSFTEWISPQIEELLGYPVDDWLHDPCMFPSVLHPDDRARVLDEIRRTRESDEPFRSEYRVLAQDGRTVWVYDETVTARDDDGRPLFRQGVLLDVTERKEAEEALRAADTRYRALVEQLPLVVFTNLPGRDVRTSYISPQVERTLGYSIDEWLADTSLYERLLHPADRERVLGDVWRSREDGTRFSADFRMIARDGRTVWIHEECERVQDEHGETLFSQGVWLDITPQKELEEQLRHAQKMDAIGRLAGGVAHDFNNLITAMTGYADLLLESLAPSDARRFDVEQIGIAARRAAGLTQQLLAFSRKQVLHLKVLDLNEVVSAIDMMLRRLIGEDVQLESVLHPGLGRVRADLGQLEQVIVNLAVNARDAMPRGGKLTLETSETELDEVYARERAEAVPPGPYVVLTVTDTGHGMDAETIESVFEPFFTTKEAGRGTGLGLATVYGIVTQSGGHIDVTSEAGAGTSFRIYLPRVEEEAAPLPAAPAREAAGGTETILLVEDEVMLRTLIRQQLERRGYTVLEASTAAEALALAATHERPIELLLTDVVMPELSGFEVAAEVEARRPETRVLYVTGYSERAVDDGLGDREDILPKPFTMDELASRVRDVLDG